MKRISLLLLLIFAVSIAIGRSAETLGLIERPAAETGPTQVSVGIWIVDISKIDSAEQSFTAESPSCCVGKIRGWLIPAAELCVIRSNRFGIHE
jgi:hypothetical protein